MPHGFPSIPEDSLYETLENGHTLVTVNRRLARRCFRGYGLVQQQRGRQVWESPDVLPYQAWLQRSYQESLSEAAERITELPVPLEPHQELYVWEEAVREAGGGDRLLQTGSAAGSAMEAWRICHEWRIPWREIEEAAGPDTAVFLEWCRCFRERCRRNGWLDSARLQEKLAALADEGLFAPPGLLVVAGFDEMPPLMLRLLEGLLRQGCRVRTHDDRRSRGRVRRLRTLDSKSEAETAARWARAELERDSGQSIGILVPSLHQRRDQLARAFDGVLQPRRIMNPCDRRPRPYNISLGSPLGEHPLPAAAIAMLRLAEEPVDVELVSSVLRSPYLGEAESELSPRALLDLRIRRFGDPVIRLRALIEAAADDSSEAGGGDSGTDACPLLASRLRPFFDRVSELPSRQMPSAWARDFSRLLGDLGWPGTGERSLESAEYQAMQAWRSALGDFSRLDAVARPLRYSAALDRLESHLATQSFQPETPEMPVQILGILESAGARFDKVWIMGLDSETWPAQPQPNPFLPARVQRLHSTPHADADRELAFARRLTRRMVRAAPEAILSHPAREKDRELLPSPLVRQEQEIGPGDLEIAAESDYRRTLLRSASLELVRDDHGPEVAEGTFLPGGTSLFRAQALCPFRAFAEHRLGATGIESPGAGLGPAERGVLVHEALNSVWRTFRSRDGLLQQDAEGVRAATEEAAEHALRRMDRRRPLTMTPRFRELERKRLVSLILEWLEREKERPPFEVSELENRVSVTIGGLTVQVAADRIDRLPDGRKVVLDYKTGRNSAKQWFDERMSEPQLPLYCIAVGERIAGLAFGRVRTGDTGYEGLTEDEGILPGCETWSRSRYCGRLPSWSAVLAAWSEGLERIAREIRCGEASPEPASGRQACRDCGLLPLCRADAGEYAREESDA